MVSLPSAPFTLTRIFASPSRVVVSVSVISVRINSVFAFSSPSANAKTGENARSADIDTAMIFANILIFIKNPPICKFITPFSAPNRYIQAEFAIFLFPPR